MNAIGGGLTRRSYKALGAAAGEHGAALGAATGRVLRVFAGVTALLLPAIAI